MTRDDIIRMVKEAGFMKHFIDPEPPDWITDNCERFAALVAAEERKHCYDLIETLVKAEREACARICDELDRRWINQAEKCAERIRARSK